MKTSSEQAFERFLEENNLAFERIKEGSLPSPDYLVKVAEISLVFEVKELAEDSNFRTINDPSSPVIRVHSRIVGDHVRRKILDKGTRKQIQSAADQGLPAILLVYNNLDPMHLFGTEDHDFLYGMYGQLTIRINLRTRQVEGEPFCGRNSSVSESWNTSFSAVGRLAPILKSGKMTVTLFENVFAKVRLPYEQLPACFEVKHVELAQD